MAKKSLKKIMLLVTGSVLLIFGVTLILFWWTDVLRLFKGGAGIALALAGLLTLYMVRD